MTKIYINKYLAVFICLLMLNACQGEPCIAPDDFGFTKLVVPATYTNDKLSGNAESQTAPWINSNLIINGDPLVIIVKNWDFLKADYDDNNKEAFVSAWCPWLGRNTDGTNALSRLSTPLEDCKYQNGEMCTNPNILNKPCLMKKGVGLYALIPDKDPNASLHTMRKPNGLSFHVGAKHKGAKVFDVDWEGHLNEAGGIHYNFVDKEKYSATEKSLYFKILDTYYGDNSGQYKVVIKSGIQSTSFDPIEMITQLVENKIFGTHKTIDSNSSDTGLVQKIFKTLVSNNHYKFTVNAVLVLYITISGLLFVIGSIQMTTQELLIRAIKVVIISQLLTGDTAWDFFHDYLFVLFLEGWTTLKNIVVHAGAVGSGGNSLIGLMMAPETFKKLFSLLFIDWLGWIYIILYFLLLYFVFLVLFKATIIILAAKLAVGLLIILAPIFLCFILFDFTMSLFKTWFKQLIAFTLQPLILITGLTFMTVMIQHEIYSSLGFTVCRYNFPNIGNMSKIISGEPGAIGVVTSIFSWWFPKINPDSCNGNTTDNSKCVKKETILIPEAFVRKNGELCKAYECQGIRYPDLPYLNPDNQLDNQKIEALRQGGRGFVNFTNLYILFILVYLLYKFNEFALGISAAIVGAGPQFNLKHTYNKSLMDTHKHTSLGRRNITAMARDIGKTTIGPGAYMAKSAYRKSGMVSTVTDGMTTRAKPLQAISKNASKISSAVQSRGSLVADEVQNKGIPAAVFTTVIKTALKGYKAITTNRREPPLEDIKGPNAKQLDVKPKKD